MYIYMITNKIGAKGFVSEGTIDGTSKTVIDDYPSIPKYQVVRAGPTNVSGSSNHGIILFNTSTLDGGLNLWNLSNGKFFPLKSGQFYTLRLDGVIPLTGFAGNPVFHIDFEVSGVIEPGQESPHSGVSIDRQTVDVILRTGGSASPEHQHFHGVFVVLTTDDMVASGAQFFAASSGPEVDFLSGTLLIKEG